MQDGLADFVGDFAYVFSEAVVTDIGL
ncbi:uncharacterized protein METZ01_LOCUS477534 [marine metagenome]|uniref:Uncharacterized protein n=1 Tax=marine metagenome TaxID=408172 RepID=A0A383BXZ1_9ZZZZ